MGSSGPGVFFSARRLAGGSAGFAGEQASLRATPEYLGILLPSGFIGLLLAAALAAEMSTDSGYLLTWATVIYNDLIAPCIRKPLSGAKRLLLTRGIVLGIGVFLLFYGLWYEMPGNAWDYLAVTGNIYLASVFTLLVAGLYWRRATSAGAYAALDPGRDRADYVFSDESDSDESPTLWSTSTGAAVCVGGLAGAGAFVLPKCQAD